MKILTVAEIEKALPTCSPKEAFEYATYLSGVIEKARHQKDETSLRTLEECLEKVKAAAAGAVFAAEKQPEPVGLPVVGKPKPTPSEPVDNLPPNAAVVSPPAVEPEATDAEVPATNEARQLAAEHNIDIRLVPFNGKKVTKANVERFIQVGKR